jgi:SAM-dependent methyltransferase
MTDETSKTRAVRGSTFNELYLQGRVIDIGCGPDPIVPYAEPFDLEHGDAQEIATVRPNGAYNAVCSSHCLEHMRNVPHALAQWWALVRDGGYLILVVPDEDLYEQGGWPSIFNYDHKATFRFGKRAASSPVSYDILQLVKNLHGAEIISCERQDVGYDYARMKQRISRRDRILFRSQRVLNSVLRRCGSFGLRSMALAGHFFALLGTPVDQTKGLALAQIQIIARKRTHADQSVNASFKSEERS